MNMEGEAGVSCLGLMPIVMTSFISLENIAQRLPTSQHSLVI